MKCDPHGAGRDCHRIWRELIGAILVVAVVTTGLRAFGQARYMQRYEEPQWMTMHVTGLSAGIYAEGEFDQNNFKNADTSVTHEHVFVGPAFSGGLGGSIYHPNLLTYYLDVDGAVGWSRDSFSSAGTSSTRDEWEYLGRIGATVDLLQNKPFHASAFADYDHTFRDNDFFNRVTVESWCSGACSSL